LGKWTTEGVNVVEPVMETVDENVVGRLVFFLGRVSGRTETVLFPEIVVDGTDDDLEQHVA
jgi:hypothetical protein